MKIQGSCYCESVRFSVECPHPYPYMHCYCSICRKTAGGGGFAINLGAIYDTLNIDGQDAVSVFSTASAGKSDSPGQRNFCRHCGSALWVWDPRWPELVHPFASAIDTPLPLAPERSHIFMDSKPDWVPVPRGDKDECFQHYEPDMSLAAWHEARGLVSK